MKRMALAAAILIATAAYVPAPAQVMYASYSFGFSARGPHVHIRGFAGGYSGYYGFNPGYGPGWGPGYGNPYFLPPPAGLAPPWYHRPPVVVIVNNGFSGGALPNNPFANAPNDPPAVVPVANNVPNNAPPLGAQTGQFVMITPKPKATNPSAPAIPNGTTLPMITQVVPPVPLVPLPIFDPFANNNPGNIERPEADEDREFARLMKLAGETFEAGEYGRCVGFVERAIKVKPTDAMPLFVKAQCLFATGQYGDAVDAIRDGTKLAPDWPAGGFRPRDAYGTSPDKFDDHIAALRKALAENPGEPVLQFLLGYELWFSGKHDEATELFRAAARGAPGNVLIGRFLKEADGMVGPR